jgi:hypothetical protein
MVNNDVVFRVHFGGQFDRWHKFTYVGGDIGLNEETYDLDCQSFVEIETIVKKFGYQPGDLIYYREPGKELDDGLVFITSDEDRMTMFFLGHKLVVLYTVSVANAIDEVGPNVGEVAKVEDSDDEERRMNVINDPYWQSLISDGDDAWDAIDEPVARTSTHGDDTSTFGKDDDFHDCDEDDDFHDKDGDENDGDGGDKEAVHEEAIDLETTNVGGSRDPASLGG